MPRENYHKLGRAALIKKCYSLDNRRRTGWKNYYHERELSNQMWMDLIRIRKMHQRNEEDRPIGYLQRMVLSMLKKYEDGKHECPVCEDVMRGDDLVLTSCGHMFCADCLGSWRVKHNTCPMCRAVMK